ncbi:MAG TPA: hypothetical protein VIH60_04825 [Steroidobacteraceae bacterium]
MKPTEIGSGSAQLPPRKLKFAIDESADPPIAFEEAVAAGTANCRRHGGLIGQRGDKEGAVYLCLPCGKYWRYSKAPFRRKVRYRALGYA